MFVLDTDTLTFLLFGHERVTQRVRAATREVVSTLISRIEVLRGRFDAVLKAEDRDKLLAAAERLTETERDLAALKYLPMTEAVAGEFEHLRREKKLRKCGRADLLIACFALAHKATLVTRNQKDFAPIAGLTLENWVD